MASRPFLTSSRRIGSLRWRAPAGTGAVIGAAPGDLLRVAARASSRLRRSSRVSRGDDDVAVRVEPGRAARRHQGGRVILVDEQRPRPGRGLERGARDDRRGDRPVRRAEIGAPVAAAPGAVLLEADRRAIRRTRAVSRRLTMWTGSPSAWWP